MYGGGTNGVGVTTGAEHVYLVFWGSQWGTQGTNGSGYATFSGDPDGLAPYLQAFMKGLGTGGETWSGVMTQYCQGVSTGSQTCPSSAPHVGYPTGGALAGVWEETSAAAPAAASAHEIGAESVAAATHFGNMTSASNRDAQYVIVSPTGANPDDWLTQGFCAWHDDTGDTTLDGGGAVVSPDGLLAFTNLPYQPDQGRSCGENAVNNGAGGILDGVSIVGGHEYAETITDQYPPANVGVGGGWLDASGNENGDKCAWIQSGQGAMLDLALSTGSFAVQSTWANDFNGGRGGCETSHTILTGVTVTDPGPQMTTLGEQSSLQVQATDSAGLAITYSATGLPPGLSIESSSGDITGAVTAAGSYSVTVHATDSNSNTGSTSFGWSVESQPLTASSSLQYNLNGSDGASWQPIDATNLSLDFTPAASGYAVIVGNADLWTANAGYNQDLGINVSPQLGPSPVPFWKESGGHAGTFSPNAAAVQGYVPVAAGTAYTVQLVWKTNIPMPSGDLIYDGAGSGAPFSPTTLVVYLYAAGSNAFTPAISTTQYTLNSTAGPGWQATDSSGQSLPSLSVTPSTTGPLTLTGNADLWTYNSGINQDIGIQVTPPCNNNSATPLLAWKESGGFAGTFSPNAAMVQGRCDVTAGTPYAAQLVWKPNQQMQTGARIAAGAGSGSSFSPTTLFAVDYTSSSHIYSAPPAFTQYQRTATNSDDGTVWQDIDIHATNLTTTIPAQSGSCMARIAGNADLWTANAGINQDVGIWITPSDTGIASLIAWKESGGFAGTFSPNAAFVQAVYPIAAGTVTYTVSLRWRSNVSMAVGDTIFDGAGTMSGGFSPTTLIVDVEC